MTVSANQHQLALDVWHYAYDTQRRLNLGTVERRLAQLREHHRACACGLCAAARQVSARSLWPVVRAAVAAGAPPERRREEWPADVIFAYSAYNQG